MNIIKKWWFWVICIILLVIVGYAIHSFLNKIEINNEKVCTIKKGCLKCGNECVSWEVGVAVSCPEPTEEFECECIEQICEKKYLLDRSFKTNVKITKNILNNDYSEKVVTGYAIYKTKSCSFRTTDPPYPPESSCAKNSGYIILSDNNNARLNHNPKNSKTDLKDNELLIHYINDDTIDSIILGERYEISGIDISYNSVNSLGFIEILSSSI
ncbi:hypothetical protein GOV12_00035 [Candidatus Pacearchaeota archaeon]|nr:hypothetical protein [Candidatus Pacearchaeota archaeon]